MRHKIKKVVAFVHYLNTKHLENNKMRQTIMMAILKVIRRDVTETAQIFSWSDCKGIIQNKNPFSRRSDTEPRR